MDISINGKAADITLESERTIGEVLSGMAAWLQSSGYRLNGLEIDGETVAGTDISAVFGRELGGIGAIDIKACSHSELALDALCEARTFLTAYTNGESRGDEQRNIALLWRAAPAASFLREESARLFQDINAVFDLDGAEGAVKAARVIPLVDERVRELVNPVEELGLIEGVVAGIAERLEELPVDIQTGKDGRAAETVNLFSGVAEKLFRLFYLIQAQGQDLSGILIGAFPVYDFLGEFSTALKELLAAYEGRDVVLVGDLAEYELAPRLRSFYGALKVPA
jgi:tellurite resistance protein